MLMTGLVFIAVVLVVAMFATKNMMLGFPSAIFWAILSGYCYEQSLVTWDIYYMVFFASMCMAIFCMLAMYALRTKKEEQEAGDELIDEGKDDIAFIDEGQKAEEERTGNRAKGVRQRAERRRKKGIVRPITGRDLD